MLISLIGNSRNKNNLDLDQNDDGNNNFNNNSFCNDEDRSNRYYGGVGTGLTQLSESPVVRVEKCDHFYDQ